MSTADKKAGHGAAWANLIVCGGISWAVSLWHATHATKGSALVLAILAATAPVVTAAFASHHVVKKGAHLAKRIMTIVVFAMGMSLSVKAQAQSIGPIVGGVELGVVFALMLDVSTFLALSSIMSKGGPQATVEVAVAPSNGHTIQRPADTALDTFRERPADTWTDASTDTRRTPPVERPRTRAKAAPRTPAKTVKSAPVDTRAMARELLKANPDMNAAELARKLERKPAGSIRMMRSELLEELRDAGELPSVRALGA